MRTPQSRRLAVATLCLLPVLFALPVLGEPYGQAEEAVNASIWGLGARNLWALGPSAAKWGAVVAPFPGTHDGVYAHHPPLVVWLCALVAPLGAWEGWIRLLGLASAVAALALLHRVARRLVSDDAALWTLSVAATSAYVLSNGRLFSTLTLAAPLFLALLDQLLASPRWRWPLPLLAAALVLSAWDGVVGAFAVAAVVAARDFRAERKVRAFVPLAAAAAALALVLLYLVNATGGLAELRHQFGYRAQPNVPVQDWLWRQAGWVGGGVGPVSALALLALPWAWWRSGRPRLALWALGLAALPGAVMLLVFRQGAQRHPFWGYALAFAGALAVGLALELWKDRLEGRRRRAALAALLLQSLLGAGLGRAQLARDSALNQAGALAAAHFQGAREVPVFARYEFHTFIAWTLGAAPRVLKTGAALRAQVESGLVFVDTAHTRELRCRDFEAKDATQSGRWVVAEARALADACP